MKNTGELLKLDMKAFQFHTTATAGPLLTKAIARYAAILANSMSVSGAQHADMRSLRWLRQRNVISASEHDDIMQRITLEHISVDAPASAASLISGCDISVVTSAEAPKTIDTDESYSLVIRSPRIVINAKTVYGAMYAMESLAQLVSSGSVNGTEIVDAPRFAFRGTMIDTARHFYPLPVIKQHLDAMAAVKMNVLHWHVVDSQSFPFESASYPALSRGGAWASKGHSYALSDVRELVSYAAERGIRVVPEFDTPGHVGRGWESSAVLTTCYDAGGSPTGTGPLNPTLNLTYEVLENLYGDVLAAFYPETYVHVGGDEVATDCWESNPQIAAWLAHHPHVGGVAGLQRHFEDRLLSMLQRKGASAMLWQEGKRQRYSAARAHA